MAAFSEFRADVENGSFPEDRYLLHMAPEELATFVTQLDRACGRADTGNEP